LDDFRLFPVEMITLKEKFILGKEECGPLRPIMLDM
jgi:hypothetical protein